MAEQHVNLGWLIRRPEMRDAIHIACAPVVAGGSLEPGQRIRVTKGSNVAMAVAPGETARGIVDPWLPRAVMEGESFWMLLNPNTITSLRHLWTHPDFPGAIGQHDTTDAAAVIEARAHLEAFANELGVGYDELLQNATAYLRRGYYWSEGGRFEGVSLPEDFWQNYSIVTDNKDAASETDSFFSCSC